MGDFGTVMAVPYRVWANRHERVLAILHPHRHEEELGFHWPLIADNLALCRVAVSASAFEIAPPCVPVDQIPTFVRARRRLYLTATLAGDSILITHFGANADTLQSPVTPRAADDLGDLMILTPQDTFPGVSDEHVRQFVVDQARHRNVVVIVRRTAGSSSGPASEDLPLVVELVAAVLGVAGAGAHP